MENILLLGDCKNELLLILDECVDFIFCDLPYGTTACKWDTKLDINTLFSDFNRVLKPDCVMAFTATQPFTTELINANRNQFKYTWYWNKSKTGNFAIAKFQPLRVIEEVLIFQKGNCRYYPQMTKAEEKNKRPRKNTYNVINGENTQALSSGYTKHSNNEDLRHPINYLYIPANTGECNNIHRIHPTQKPVDLLEYLIKTYTQEGDLVLDATAGSMTTAIAAINTNRKYVCIESDYEIFKRGKQRVEEKLATETTVPNAFEKGEGSVGKKNLLF